MDSCPLMLLLRYFFTSFFFCLFFHCLYILVVYLSFLIYAFNLPKIVIDKCRYILHNL